MSAACARRWMASPARHSRPSNWPSTGPRKYSWCCGGGAPRGVRKRTRSATLSSRASWAMLPTRMSSDRPVRPFCMSVGRPHSGAMRGNSTNSAAMMGAPSSAMRPAMRSDCASGGRPTGIWAFTSAASSPSSASSMAAATGRAWEKKKLDSSVKKPRKNTTMASRRPCSSSVLRPSSITISVTPASRPRMVRWVYSVPATAITSGTASTQRVGSGRPLKASQPRHSINPAASRLAQAGNTLTCGAMTHAITTSRNSVSRASRGSAWSVWRRLMAARRGGGRWISFCYVFDSF